MAGSSRLSLVLILGAFAAGVGGEPPLVVVDERAGD